MGVNYNFLRLTSNPGDSSKDLPLKSFGSPVNMKETLALFRRNNLPEYFFKLGSDDDYPAVSLCFGLEDHSYWLEGDEVSGISVFYRHKLIFPNGNFVSSPSGRIIVPDNRVICIDSSFNEEIPYAEFLEDHVKYSDNVNVSRLLAGFETGEFPYDKPFRLDDLGNVLRRT